MFARPRLRLAVLLLVLAQQLASAAAGRALAAATAPAAGLAGAPTDATTLGLDGTVSGTSYITPGQFPPPSTAYRRVQRCWQPC